MRTLRNPFALSCFLIVGLAFLVFALVKWVPFGNPPAGPFFNLSAQTIPVLLVALAVEAQARQFDNEESRRFLRMVAVTFLALGEIAAVVVAAGLYGPAYGSAEYLVFVVVTAMGLIGGFLAVVAVAMTTPREKTPLTGRMLVEPVRQEVAVENAPGSDVDQGASGESTEDHGLQEEH